MGTYGIPRNTKGESRILYIFSIKALIYTAIGAAIGGVFYFLFKLVRLTIIGIIFVLLFGLIGFCIGTFKIPENNSFELGKKAGGENLDEVIKRSIKFKMKKDKIYVYTKEEIEDEQ